MEYEEFAAFVWDIISRNKAYEAIDEGEGDPDTETLHISVSDKWGDRTTTMRLGEVYAVCKDEDRNRVRTRIRQMLPWDGKGSSGLTCDACRQILGAERQPMFESLRLLRQAYARRENVAPYVIFSNTALLAMCQQGPETMEALQELPGVGLVNSVRYGQGFLELIRYHNQKRGERIASE